VRFVVEPDSGFLGGGDWWSSAPAIAPDGRTIVYASSGHGGARLYARRVDDLTARPLPGTEDGDWPFFSPDGEWVGFASRGTIRKVRLDGGMPVVVTELPASAGRFFGGSWGPDDAIVYSMFFSGALYRVPAAGGSPSLIAVADTSRRLIHPTVLPGGRALLLTSTADWRVGRVGVLDLASGRVREFGPGAGARYVAGHVLYVGAGGALYRQPFDLDRLAPSGPATEIASGLDVSFAAYSPFDASPSGALVYRVSRGSWKLTLVDRPGREKPLLGGPFFWAPRFSRDGSRIAYTGFPPGQEAGDAWSGDVWRTDVWIADLASAATHRVTTDGNDNSEPQWSPDGRSIVFDANIVGKKDLFVKTLDRGSVRPLTRRPGDQFPSDWAPDGSGVLFTEAANRADADIWVQPTDGSAARPYLATTADERAARVSADGHWAAYNSNETGRSEVYIQSYPTPGRKLLVSNGGGVDPAWRRDGRELYYWQGNQMVAVSLDAGRAGQPPVVRGRTPLFRMARVVAAGYDVSPDGTRFAFVTGGARASRLIVVLNALGVEPDRAPGAR
jgi:Tol biopolymer transport system component